MTRKDYETLAPIVGNMFRAARQHGGEDFRTVVYENLYVPLVAALTADNPRFDITRFAFAVSRFAKQEHNTEA